MNGKTLKLIIQAKRALTIDGLRIVNKDCLSVTGGLIGGREHLH
jgi:hypothetical protein